MQDQTPIFNLKKLLMEPLSSTLVQFGPGWLVSSDCTESSEADPEQLRPVTLMASWPRLQS